MDRGGYMPEMDNGDVEMSAWEAAQQREAEPPPVLSTEEFLEWRSPREVKTSPTVLDNPLWHWLVRTRQSAYSANEKFDGPSAFEAGPMWCFDRFGISRTELPDGRIIYIGGEHEDHYDPDFFIYNDVVVIDPDGSICIRGYARDEFPATDFHSATAIGNEILIIGCLGYPEQRVPGQTPVYRLSLDTWHIDRVLTHGESPGWIYKHAATISEDGNSIIVSSGECWLGKKQSASENFDQWSLHVNSGCWTQLTALDWQQWSMKRKDGRRNRLWDIRQALWAHENSHLGLDANWRYEDEPDFEELARLYQIDGASPVVEGTGHEEFRVVIDGLTVRFMEGLFCVKAVVEGRLSEERLKELQCRVLETLSRLHAAEWDIEPLSGSSS
jgi:hypothetical protein